MKQQRGQSGRGRRPRPGDGPQSDIEQKLIEIKRVTRVVAGGKRMRFRACVILGDRKGLVGMGVGKGADVTMAVQKAVTKAQKKMVKVPISNDTIPHIIRHKQGAAFILLKPAPRGTGVKAGGAVRSVLDIAGIQNVVAKILGGKNKMNNVKATIAALALLRPRKERARA